MSLRRTRTAVEGLLRGSVALLVLIACESLAQEEKPRRSLVPLPPGFSSGARFPTLAAADYDSDGVPDLAVLNSQAGLLKVIALREGGTAEELSSISVGLSPTSVTADDVDGDGHSDVVVGSNGSRQVTIAYGDGRGRFSEVQVLPIPEPVRAQALGEFTGDGLLDIVTVGGGSGTAVILTATGRRVFGGQIRLATPVRYPHVVVTGDFNGDGLDDFAVWGRDTVPPRFAVLESQGAGRFSESFSPSPPLPDPGPLVPVLGAVAADFDGDAADELLVFSETATTIFSVWKTESGLYTSSPVGPMLGVPASLQAADMEGDGQLDAVVLVGGSLRGVSVLRGLAGDEPRFEETCIVFPQSGSSLLVAQDFDRDGTIDILLVQPPEGRVEVIFSPVEQCGGADDCLGGLAPRCHEVEGPFPSSHPERLAVADFDGDGGDEVLTLGDGRAKLLRREGPALRELWTAPIPAVTEGPAVGDLDGNGSMDFAAADLAGGSLLVFLQGGTGFPDRPSRTLEGGVLAAGVAVEDFNADGRLDAAGSLLAENRVAVFLGSGAGDFAPPLYTAAGRRPDKLAASDFDGDRIPDLVVVNKGEAAVSLLRCRGDGTFEEPAPLGTSVDPDRIAIADLDADGRSDVAVTGSGADGVEVLWSGEAGDRARMLKLMGASSAATDLRLEDIDGDGLTEVVVADAGLHSAALFWNLGGGAFAPRLMLPVCRSEALGEALAVGVGDMEGDGLADLVVGDSGNDFLHLFRSVACSRPAAFRRGDIDFDQRVNLTDAVLSLNVLFLGGDPFRCADAADVDDSGHVNVTDAVQLLNYQFLGGLPPEDPGPRRCGIDPTTDFLRECESSCR